VSGFNVGLHQQLIVFSLNKPNEFFDLIKGKPEALGFLVEKGGGEQVLLNKPVKATNSGCLRVFHSASPISVNAAQLMGLGCCCIVLSIA
jgi:hypothetical protein